MVPAMEMILDFAVVVFGIPSIHMLNFEVMSVTTDTVIGPRCN